MLKTYNIFGSCVSRDIFGLVEDHNYSVDYYQARSSVQSMMSKPYSVDWKYISTGSNFKDRVVYTDINKDYFEQLWKHRAHDLIIDFIDERFALYKIGFSYVTRSNYFLTAGLKNLLGGYEVKKTETIEDWDAACLAFIEKLKSYYHADQVILHKAYFAEEYVDNAGKVQKFDDRKTKIYQSINQLLDHYYHFFESHFENIHTIGLPQGSYRAWEEHKWGLGPMHYERNYYQEMVNQLEDINRKKKDKQI
ncbi:DUF6270 domain-containing protein [Gracilibacillus timonensis]|uniref:DUF6270 domain-containing protein n=1 Tax=Gracilibacillus timonensis TaxID=1816696 RepID=UPI00082599F5|nr:DUF6270 domain-containing protein [Gracilibacillus timonensis]